VTSTDTAQRRRASLDDLTLLVIERTPSGTDAEGFPTHELEVEVAMYPGANPGVARLERATVSRSTYTDEQFMEIVTAAWQQDDPSDPSPIPDPADRTEQNTYSASGEVDGSVYVVRAGLERGTGKIAPGSVRREDPDSVPGFVMEAQEQAVRAVRERATGRDVLTRISELADQARSSSEPSDYERQ